MLLSEIVKSVLIDAFPLIQKQKDNVTFTINVHINPNVNTKTGSKLDLD